MSRSQRPTRVHTTNPRTIGGGLEWRDLFPLPIWLWFIALTVKSIYKHFFGLILTIALLVWFVQDWVEYGLASAAIRASLNLSFFLILIAALLYLIVYLRYTYAPNFKRLSFAICRWYVIRKRWSTACYHAGLRHAPKLKKIRFTPNGVTAIAKCGKKGITPNDFRAGGDEIVGTLGAHELKIDSQTPALATLHFIWGDPTSRILLPGDLAGMSAEDDMGVIFSLDPDHQGVEVSTTTPIAIFGESESGKSNALWSILNGLNMRGIPYQLRVIDPAGGVELQELEDAPCTLDYVDTVPQAEPLIARAHAYMQERLARMKAEGVSKLEVSEDEPLDIVLVDELLLLSKYDEHSLFGQRLSSGRKAGCIVIALSQLSQKDALGSIRDLFPQRMCHATKSLEMTSTALGPNAERDGAKCSAIPKSTPGVGYIYNKFTRSYTRFRTPLISKDDRLAIAAGEVIYSRSNALISSARSLKLRRTAVYKFFTHEGRLGYTGIAWNPEKRQAQHLRNSWWFDQIDLELTEIEWYPRRKDAKAAETWSIVNERPLFNKAEKVHDNEGELVG